jgi:cytochrome c oxidase assembly protein subunit 11
LTTLKKVEDRPLKLKFMASTSTDLQWSFAPCQTEIHLTPGETVLAFYRAKNNTNRPIVGIATYNILPFEAALYFNKVQCFCFEEQCIEPGEEVDLPVFFFIDEGMISHCVKSLKVNCYFLF